MSSQLELVNKVKVKIDEITSSTTPIQTVTVVDENPIDTIIASLLDECALEILLKAPFHRLTISSSEFTNSSTDDSDNSNNSEGSDSSNSTPTSTSNTTNYFLIQSDKSVIINLPEDFLRLVSFRLDGWERSVTELSIKGDHISTLQSNKYTRGTPSRPIGVLCPTYNAQSKKTQLAIEAYSLETSEKESVITEFLYIKKCPATDITGSQMIEAMTWICAGKVLSVMGNIEDAKNAYDNAQSLMI